MIRVRVKLLDPRLHVSNATQWLKPYALGSAELPREESGMLVKFAGAAGSDGYVDAWMSFVEDRPPAVKEGDEFTLHDLSGPIATGWIVFLERR